MLFIRLCITFLFACCLTFSAYAGNRIDKQNLQEASMKNKPVMVSKQKQKRVKHTTTKHKKSAKKSKAKKTKKVSRQKTKNTKVAKININTADEEILSSIKGISTKRAAAIISYRDDHGRFKSVDELKQIKGIGTRFIDTNQDRLKIKD